MSLVGVGGASTVHIVNSILFLLLSLFLRPSVPLHVHAEPACTPSLHSRVLWEGDEARALPLLQPTCGTASCRKHCNINDHQQPPIRLEPKDPTMATDDDLP